MKGLGQCLAYSKASVKKKRELCSLWKAGHSMTKQAGPTPTSTTPSRSPPSKRQLRHHLSSREKPQGDSFWGALDR